MQGAAVHTSNGIHRDGSDFTNSLVSQTERLFDHRFPGSLAPCQIVINFNDTDIYTPSLPMLFCMIVHTYVSTRQRVASPASWLIALGLTLPDELCISLNASRFPLQSFLPLSW